eukprot:CAMPEP_0118815554 /NCGR_PEP_ID=MMETSP1162-20130426/4269_1 /TAXON_ID=33656 /ORGANISM="Phaeocystis Sp, Strain CCMP2710" /LENGTH=169 /DNA_ID=CAMNT_0006745533 /DNA_START=15 /DNA_END=524 /DNA_ORIENTATION=+
MADRDDTETVAISDMTYATVMETGTLVKEGMLMKRPSRQGAIQLGMTKQRFILLQTDRLLWFKKGEQNDCILGEIPITPQTELLRYPASLVATEKMTVKTGVKELDLMPIKIGDLDAWHQVLEEQIELIKRVQTSADNCASLAPVGCEGLCRAAAGCLHMLAPPKARAA